LRIGRNRQFPRGGFRNNIVVQREPMITIDRPRLCITPNLLHNVVYRYIMAVLSVITIMCAFYLLTSTARGTVLACLNSYKMRAVTATTDVCEITRRYKSSLNKAVKATGLAL